MNILMIITLLIGLVYARLALKSISSFPSTFKVSICVSATWSAAGWTAVTDGL